jgi:phosphotransferase system  glucose/maltose/N-acetylglucosamine-specific IIC component
MNTIAVWLYITGVLAIIGGIILGFQNYEVVIGYEESILSSIDPEPIIEKSWPVFWVYTLTGVVSGILLFGFAEIINILDDIRNRMKDHQDKRESKEYKNKSKFNDFVEKSIRN